MSTESTQRLVVVSYDAASNGFAVTPNPLTLGPGEHKMYLALQTVNRGDAKEAKFLAIYEDNLITSAQRVGTCDQLWQVDISNPPSEKEPETFNYTVRIKYAGVERSHDPSVVLQPPATEPPAHK